MSKTLSSLASAGCGCPTVTPVKPENLAIVPQGSTIVQAPCAENCLPPSSSAASNVQPGGSESSCQSFRNPCVTQNFVVSAIGKQGQFFAECAASWAMAGLRLYFGNLGYLEVTGFSGNVVSYRNLTIEAGTSILEGTCFHHDGPPIAIVGEDEGDEGFETSATLDAIYGEEGNVQKKIVPVDGMQIIACGGKWIRHQRGLQFYPVARQSILSFSGSVGAKNWTAALPNLPSSSAITCSLNLFADVDINLFSVATTSSGGPRGDLKINNITRAGVNASGIDNHPGAMVEVGKSNTSLTVDFVKRGTTFGVGTFGVDIYLNGYFY